ncbi:sex peptide receptor-like [Mya arenaria]|uniref:sex peptide receptor-like n=1 Tax=Mya arenaria TaxID=6604 RepID=UPI0022E6F7EF|nr:sex peptide receptor-like [Mya arenaria]
MDTTESVSSISDSVSETPDAVSSFSKEENHTYTFMGTTEGFLASTEYFYPDEEYYDYGKYYGNENMMYNDTTGNYSLELFEFEKVTLGYVRPILVLCTILANIFVFTYFLTRKRRGKASNLLFVSIAISDTLTGVAFLPNSFNVYLSGEHYLSKFECNTFMILKMYFARVFHTVSIWQTVCLGLQRYLCVCHPFTSRRICTFWKTFVSVVVMYALAFSMHIYQLIDEKAKDGECKWETDFPCGDACLYMWICIAFMHFLPGIVLLTLTIITVFALRKAQRRASTIMSHRKNKTRNSKEKIITITAFLIVVCFLIPEIPHGAYKLYIMLSIYIESVSIPDAKLNHTMISVYEILLLVSFHANFWIYCAMMYEFRQALVKIITLDTYKRGFARLRSFSASSIRKSDSFRSIASRSGSISSRKRVHSRTTSVHSTTSENINAVYPKPMLNPPKKNAGPPDFSSTLYKADNENDEDVFV